MANAQDVLSMRFVPTQTQYALFVLRVLTGLNLFLHHGWEKNPAHWADFMAHFADPIGIGMHASFLIAFVSDFVCAILVTIGLATRWAALFCFCNIFVAWAFYHHFAFFGKGPGEHGELIVLYLVAMLTLFLAGPGEMSLDHLLAGKR
jgi:putative oxidoreductase